MKNDYDILWNSLDQLEKQGLIESFTTVSYPIKVVCYKDGKRITIDVPIDQMNNPDKFLKRLTK